MTQTPEVRLSPTGDIAYRWPDRDIPRYGLWRLRGGPAGGELVEDGELADWAHWVPLVPDTSEELDQILREAGIEYPLGLRGVRDLVNQRDGQTERAREAEDLASRTHEAMMAKYAEAAELRDELAKRTASLEMSLETSRHRAAERDALLAEVTELRAMKVRLDEKRDSLALDYTSENNRMVDTLDRITGDLT